jgi:serine protease
MTVVHRFRPGAVPVRFLAQTAVALAAVVSAAGCRVDDPVGVTAVALSPKSVAVAGTTIQGRYIVVLRDSVADIAGTTTRVLRGTTAQVGRAYERTLKGFSAVMSDDDANALSRNPAVAFVEADRIVTGNGLQTSAPWATDRIDQRSRPLSGTYSWSTDGTGVNVYILDSGIRTGHEQFGGRARSVYGAIGDGWDSGDCSGHGTYAAGLAASDQYGSAKRANLLSVRVLDCSNNGTTSGVIAGLDWLAANRALPAVANMSFGLPYSAALNQAVQNVINAGVTVTVSAGNDGLDACNYSPASVGGAVTVGGTTDLDNMASWSNRGPCVDLFAPGHDVFSTWNRSDLYSSVMVMTGSSASAGLAAGAAAMYLADNPSASPATVAAALVAASTTGVLAGVPAGTPNRLLYVGAGGGTGDTTVTPPVTTDKPPTASLTVSCRKTVCTFSGAGSTDDKGIVSYSWSFGDGQTASTTSPAVSHTYVASSTYTATLIVADVSNQKAQASIVVKLKGR